MIVRSNPDIGYFAQEVFDRFAFTQTIKAGNLVFLSGVTPLRGDLTNLELVGEGDLRAQAEWVLEVLRRCLAEEGATFHNLVAETVYTTDIRKLVEVADVLPAGVRTELPNGYLGGGHRPVPSAADDRDQRDRCTRINRYI
jgi:2-iminobutanoate/2-iminopropanoate deaminase